MINRIKLSNTLHLSCVENYFLAWLEDYYDVTKLYGYQFLSLKQLFYDFKYGARYENYYTISRIQDIAEQFGIISHNYYFCEAGEAFDTIQKNNNNTLCLVKVNSNFFSKFKRSSWREDHYICVDSNLSWINQYPLSEGKFTFDEFKECFDGALCIYQIKDLSCGIEEKVIKDLVSQDFNIKDIPTSLTSLLSAVGILRVTRKRLKHYFYNHNEIQFLLNLLNDYLDKLYFQIRITELKKLSIKRVEDLIIPIIDYEKMIAEELRKNENGN